VASSWLPTFLRLPALEFEASITERPIYEEHPGTSRYSPAANQTPGSQKHPQEEGRCPDEAPLRRVDGSWMLVTDVGCWRKKEVSRRALHIDQIKRVHTCPCASCGRENIFSFVALNLYSLSFWCKKIIWLYRRLYFMF